MEKIVKTGLRDCTVNLDGTECAVRFDGCFRVFAVRNDSAGDVYISKTAGIVPDADGVMSVKAGASTVYAHMDMYADTVYLLGKGKVQLHAQNDVINPFNYAPAMDGGEERGESSYTIENAVDYPLMGLNLYGKSTQGGTPTPENPVEIVSVGDIGSVSVQSCGKNLFDYSLLPDTAYNGVTFKNNNDGTYTIRGAKDDVSKSFLVISELSHEESIKMFSPGTYTLSGIPKEWGWGAHLVVHVFYNGQAHNSLMNTVNRPTLTITKDMLTDDFAVSVGFYSASNNQINNGTFYIQIEKGSTATAYEPYKGNTANITSAMPLCGIPVESGGNYTDSNGQQWVCDYVDFARGVKVQRIRKYILTGVENWNKTGTVFGMPYASSVAGVGMCNYFDNAQKIYDKDNCMCIYNAWIDIRCSSYNSIDEFKSFLSQMKDNGNPVTVYTADKTSVETPISEAELQAYRQLQTYNGVTNIFNDGGADMSVNYCSNKTLSEYVVPITTSLQAQIDELKSAVLSLGGNI